MIKGKQKESLTLRTVLARISEYDIYRFYIGHDFVLGKAFTSPFRKENNPSFTVMLNRSGKLYHTDFADTTKRGDCIDFVMQVFFGIDYREALLKIDKDFGLGITHFEVKDYKSIINTFSKPTEESKRTIIQVKTRRFDSAELSYWGLYYINESELRDNNVFAVNKIYLNRQLLPLKASDLVFAYLFEDRWKIYKPLAENKKDKWITNVPNDRMSGMHRITPNCQKVVITKSKKDEILLAKFLPHVCSVQSESTASINTQNIKLLQANCNEIYLNFDSDEVGVQSCKYYNQYGFRWVNCPKGFFDTKGKMIKDFTDLARYKGLQTVIDYFKKKGILE